MGNFLWRTHHVEPQLTEDIMSHTNLSKQQIHNLYQRFKALDMDGNESLDVRELLKIAGMACNPLRFRIMDVIWRSPRTAEEASNPDRVRVEPLFHHFSTGNEEPWNRQKAESSQVDLQGNLKINLKKKNTSRKMDKDASCCSHVSELFDAPLHPHQHNHNHGHSPKSHVKSIYRKFSQIQPEIKEEDEDVDSQKQLEEEALDQACKERSINFFQYCYFLNNFIIGENNRDSKGSISKEEEEKKRRELHLRVIFDMYDRRNRGFLTENDLKSVLTKMMFNENEIKDANKRMSVKEDEEQRKIQELLDNHVFGNKKEIVAFGEALQKRVRKGSYESDDEIPDTGPVSTGPDSPATCSEEDGWRIRVNTPGPRSRMPTSKTENSGTMEKLKFMDKRDIELLEHQRMIEVITARTFREVWKNHEIEMGGEKRKVLYFDDFCEALELMKTNDMSVKV